MTAANFPQRKSADALAFEHYLRCGERLTTAEWLERQDRKFNPYHDELGQFTFATGAVGMASKPAVPKPAQARSTFSPARTPTAKPQQAETTPRRVAAISGYPEEGSTAWRSSNDLAFSAAANFYNRKYSLKPGDKGYRTPEFMKAWAMRESGGEGDSHAFTTDPFQVNIPDDWDDKKRTLAGLREGERMTPAKSAFAALEWLRYKAYRYGTDGKPDLRYSEQRALERYNANRDNAPDRSGPHYKWYARTILQMAREAEARKK